MAVPSDSKLHLHLLEHLMKNCTTSKEEDMTHIATNMALTTYTIMAEMDLTYLSTGDFTRLSVATWKLLEYTYQDLGEAIRCANKDIIQFHLRKALAMGRVHS
jgi:hypothetical protein